MARKTLTDRLLRTLKADTADAVVPGLAVRIGAAGQKTFVLIGRYPGRTESDPAGDRRLSGDLAGTGPRHRPRLDCPHPARHRPGGPGRDRTRSKPRSPVQHLRRCRRILSRKARCQPAHCNRHRPTGPRQADLALARSADRHDRQARRDRHDRRHPGEVRRRHGPTVTDLCAPSVWLGRGARSCRGQSMRRRPSPPIFCHQKSAVIGC